MMLERQCRLELRNDINTTPNSMAIASKIVQRTIRQRFHKFTELQCWGLRSVADLQPVRRYGMLFREYIFLGITAIRYDVTDTELNDQSMFVSELASSQISPHRVSRHNT